MSVRLEVRALSEKEFGSVEKDWARLLHTSTADPLFMSWPWLYSWWETWGSRLGLELVLLGVYLPDGKQLVGIAPLYRHRFRIAIGMKVTRLHFLGNAWRVSPTVRTEYVGLIVEPQREREVADAVARYLCATEWDELMIPDSQQINGGTFGKALAEHCNAIPLLRSESQGIRVDTTGSFRTWAESLGANTRLKAFNRRAVFEKELSGHWQPVEEDQVSQSRFMDSLNDFHQRRWGKPCFDRQALEFHLKLLGRLGSNQRPELSGLVADGKVVSVLYDIRAGERIYNLQSGYDESLHRKLSLGTLHLGYAIERAFHHPSVCCYDLLAGSGKKTFYKSHFHGQQVDFPTLDFVRSPILRAAYHCRPWLPGNLVSRINRVFRL
ncbi:GNAT family N-acetyltransferase [Marinobacter panjinensis]|uniref:GNAT family N-acetyltransferase n=1 Tax=Marinobacter panjinensis TaxID=2576384 RepID=UPI0021ACE261|nr:GNAT family N-acetyltransferase [Marinobacter panjinensis]